jgi:hypothetical protein
MVYVGQCLTIGLIPVALLGAIMNGFFEKHVTPPVPWPIFVAGLICVFAMGIGMLIRQYRSAQIYDPNDEAVEARKGYGQARATRLPEQAALDLLAQAPAYHRPR